jgi:hypothetical protein
MKEGSKTEKSYKKEKQKKVIKEKHLYVVYQ